MNKTVKIVLVIFAAFILLTSSFAGGFITRHALAQTNFFPGFNESPVHPDFDMPLPPTSAPPTGEQTETTPSDLQNLFVPFWEAWNTVHNDFVDQPVDDELLMQGAIRGMMEALGDKQTFYMDPQIYEDELTPLVGYEGIGAQVDTSGDYLTIISPFQGSPAEAVGLRPGDMIIAIDGEDMSEFTPEEARQRVLGEAGTTVVLTIAREGESEPLDFSIVRASITVPSVTGEMLENDIAYIDINSFGDSTTRELREILDELLLDNPKGIIIDVRFNPGGYLTTSVEITSEFIDEGSVVLIEQYGDGTRDIYDALGNGRATDMPIVILINEGSASASEILAGALQDYGRAQLVGAQSYGKGSVQIWQPLSNNQGAARVTVAKWLTPNERAIDGIGLTPDHLVEMTEEDYINHVDPQLDKAIEVLTEMIAQ